MGLFSRKTTANVPQDPASTLGRGDVLPSDNLGGRLKAGSNAALDKASQVYHKNPKLIGGLALLAGALVLNRMKRPH